MLLMAAIAGGGLTRPNDPQSEGSTSGRSGGRDGVTGSHGDFSWAVCIFTFVRQSQNSGPRCKNMNFYVFLIVFIILFFKFFLKEFLKNGLIGVLTSENHYQYSDTGTKNIFILLSNCHE